MLRVVGGAHVNRNVGVYLAVGIGGTTRLRRFAYPLAIRHLSMTAVNRVLKTFEWLDTVHIVTDCPWLFWGMPRVTLHPVEFGPTILRNNRWRCATFKTVPGALLRQFEYLMYLDFDTLILSPTFLEEYLRAPVPIKMLPAVSNTRYSNALLSEEQAKSYCFDSCFFLAETRFLEALCERFWRLLQERPEVLGLYSEMPYINRALADLGIEPTAIVLKDGVTWAQDAVDLHRSIYHFNSGTPWHKILRIRAFLKKHSSLSGGCKAASES